MNALDKLRRNLKFFEAGIIPIGIPDDLAPTSAEAWHDMNRILESMPPEEARIAKRKFRKLWRAAAKAELRNKKVKRNCGRKTAASLGLGVVEPKRSHKNMRKWRVAREIAARAGILTR